MSGKVLDKRDVESPVVELNQKNIQTIQLTNSKIIKNKSIKGFLRSRIIYYYIFIISFIPLLKLLKKNTPEYFIAHLITPLPLIINYFFNIKTKLVLRISGFPKLNILRLFVWNITLKKVSLITCPTLETKNFIYNLNLINKNKLHLLYDPVISSKQIKIKQKENFNDISINNFFLSVGRLTKQKNFIFLVKTFIIFNKDYKNKLVIAGEGEDRPKIEKLIKDSNQQNNIFLIGYKENIFSYFEKCKCFILSSLWEDPGFVIVEAGYMNSPIISSDCKNGPIEFLDNGNGGILFKSNDEKSLLEGLKKFENLDEKQIKKFTISAKKSSRNFSIFSHYKKLSFILEKKNEQ